MRFQLFKLAWDLVGTEFAGRHLQYEKFFGGASFIVRGHSYREAPWDQYHGIVDDLLAGIAMSHTTSGMGEPVSGIGFVAKAML
jgi:aromatic ring hydroxylase